MACNCEPCTYCGGIELGDDCTPEKHNAIDRHVGKYEQTCKCKDTLSTMIHGRPMCAKCGKVQVD